MQRSDLSEDLQDLASLTRDVAQSKIAPLIRETEESATFNPEIQQILSAAGFFGLVVPEEYGGIHSDIGHQCIVLEEIARVYPSACTYLTAHWLATKLIALHATGENEAGWVRPLLEAAAAGHMLGAIASPNPTTAQISAASPPRLARMATAGSSTAPSDSSPMGDTPISIRC